MDEPPPKKGITCPNCGQTFTGNRCPSCGRPAGGSTANRILAVVIASLLVLPLGLVGMCSALSMIGSIDYLGKSGPEFWIVMLVIGGVAFGSCAGLWTLVRNLWGD